MNKSILVAALLAVLSAQCVSAEEKARVTYVGANKSVINYA